MHDQLEHSGRKRLSNEELVAALGEALRNEGALIAKVIAMLMEVEERRLHLELAGSSMFDFCVRRLGMSEGEAYRRIAVARLARRFPQVLEAVRTQRVHLSSLVLLRELITPDNVDDLLAAAAGKTKRAVQELVARLAPKPDVPTLIRKLPPPRTTPAHEPTQAAEATHAASRATHAPLFGAASAPIAPTATRPDSPRMNHVTHVPVAAQLTPLAESRHKVQFTASSELRQKLERAQSLMRHRNVDGDFAVVVERAIDLLISKLEKEKLAAVTRPKAPKAATENGAWPKARAATPTPTRSANALRDADADANANVNANASRDRESDDHLHERTIPAKTKREVVVRDGEQCSFVGSNGERCSARDFLEIDHRRPRALGGTHDVANLRLLCRAHNQYAAEQIFGRAHVARAIQTRQRLRRNKHREQPTSGTPTSAQSLLPLA